MSRYALGRDYHKVLRGRLRALARFIEAETGPFGYRVFVDSAPVLEKPIAEQAGLGWIGKHTNLINRDAGSWFFLGELYTDLPLPADSPEESHCGTCAPALTSARRTPSLRPTNLTRALYFVPHDRTAATRFPTEFRKAIGNRIYGCDDCQLFCPWNKFATPTAEDDFAPRHDLDDADLATLFAWDEATWLENTRRAAPFGASVTSMAAQRRRCARQREDLTGGCRRPRITAA